MIDPHFLKNLPAPVRILIRPMWFFSIGLHGLLLLIPIPPQPELEPASNPKKKAVKVTQLPPLPSPSVQLPKPIPSPRVQQSFSPPAQPFPRLRQTSPLIVQPSLKIQPSKPSLVVEPITPPTSLQTPTSSPTPTSLQTPTPSPTPSAEPTPSPTPEDLFANFPHVAGTQPCTNNLQGCRQTPETQWRSVSENLKQNLEAQGYGVQKLELEDDTGRSTYKVSKDGETKYFLNLLSTSQGTLYLQTKEPLTLEQLHNAIAL